MARVRTKRTNSGKPCVDCIMEGIRTRRKTPWPGPRCATHHRAKRFDRRNYTHEKHILENYGLTSEEYWLIYHAQDGKCFVCHRATGARKKLSVDHCHKTGIVRGLLCSSCNRGVLGHLRDDIAALQRGIDYLNNPPAVRVLGARVAPIEAMRLDG